MATAETTTETTAETTTDTITTDQQQETPPTVVIVSLSGQEAKSLFAHTFRATRSSLPILHHGLVESLPDRPQPTLSTTNLTSWLTRDLGGGGARTGGDSLRVVVDLDVIITTLKGVANKALVTFTFTQTETVVEAPGVRRTLPHPHPADEFPISPLDHADTGTETAWGVVQDTAAWQRGVAHVLRYCAKDDRRPVFTAMCWNLTDAGGMELCGADSFRLGVARLPTFIPAVGSAPSVDTAENGTEHEDGQTATADASATPWQLPGSYLITPAAEVAAFAKLVDPAEPLRVSTTEHCVMLRQSALLYVVNKVAGLYPNYGRVVADSARHSAKEPRFLVAFEVATLRAAVAAFPRGSAVLRMEVASAGTQEGSPAFPLYLTGNETDATVETAARVVHLASQASTVDGQDMAGTEDREAEPTVGTTVYLNPDFLADLVADVKTGTLLLRWGWFLPSPASCGAGSVARSV
ncbi:MAG: hypothetical protein ACRDHE_09420 [Ktedonobacterales bacterium]